jgi:hypothetical protein
MIQILRFLTILKGGVYIHWDALAARSHNLRTNNEKALAANIAGSQAHASDVSGLLFMWCSFGEKAIVRV